MTTVVVSTETSRKGQGHWLHISSLGLADGNRMAENAKRATVWKINRGGLGWCGRGKTVNMILSNPLCIRNSLCLELHVDGGHSVGRGASVCNTHIIGTGIQGTKFMFCWKAIWTLSSLEHTKTTTQLDCVININTMQKSKNM